MSRTQLSKVLRDRGYVYQHTGRCLEELTDGPKRVIYHGINPIDSLHARHLHAILAMRRFLEHGHKLIVLIAGGTWKLDHSEISVDENIKVIRAQIEQVLDSCDFFFLNSEEWLTELNYMEFLTNIGKHFTISTMLQRGTIRERLLQKSLTYTEFAYMTLQAYDYLHLFLNYKCDVQLGASDQWGNIASGVDLIRRKTGGIAHACTWPILINTATGQKFGKNAIDSISLDARQVSVPEFYRFWLAIRDDMVEQLLLKMTLLSEEEIAAIMSQHSRNPDKGLAQRA